MKEEQFWRFLEHLWETKGRMPRLYGEIDNPDPFDPQMQAVEQYIKSHLLLPKDYENMPKEVIISMGKLLLEKDVQHKTKEAIMIILAHQGSQEALEALTIYSISPNKGLEAFSEMAMDECKIWNE